MKKKKRQKERKGSPFLQDDGSSSCGKQFTKKQKLSEDDHRGACRWRSESDDDGRKKRMDQFSITKESNDTLNSGKDRVYRKALYKLGAPTQKHREKACAKEAKGHHSKSGTSDTGDNTSKTLDFPERYWPKPALVKRATGKCQPQESKEEDRQLVRRRSGVDSVSDSKSTLDPSSTSSSKDKEKWLALSNKLERERRRLLKRRLEEKLANDQGKSSSESSCLSIGRPGVFRKPSISETHLKGSEGKNRLPETSKFLAGSPGDKPDLGSRESVSFKIPKKTNIVSDAIMIWKQGLKKNGKDRVRATCGPQVSEQTTCVEGSVGKYPRSGGRLLTKTAKQEQVHTVSDDVQASQSPGGTQEKVSPVCPEAGKVAKLYSKSAAWTGKSDVKSDVSEEKETDCNEREMQLVVDLLQARSQRHLEVNVVQSYGELTCMDIDPPEEIPTTSFSKEPIQQELLIILDTNILLSHLDFIKKIRSHGLGALGFPIILIPWVVMQELDALKNGKLCGEVSRRAVPAVHYIYTCLRNQEPRLWGQSMQQATQMAYELHAKNNDDRILQCCLQYQALRPRGALVLCTNDKNLCSKAILSGVRALNKVDLVSQIEQLKCEIQTHGLLNSHMSQAAEKAGSKTESVSESNRRSEVAEPCRLGTCISVLEDALQEVLSQVLATEMKIAYGELWQEIVLVKPPWTLSDLFHCFKKHWIAVFGNVFHRSQLRSVEHLSDTLCKDRTPDRQSVQSAVLEARELLHMLAGRAEYSEHLARFLSALEPLLQEPVQPHNGAQEKFTNTSGPGPSSDEDTVMAVEEGLSGSQPSHQEVWAVFENIWRNVCDMSSAVFAAFQFVPGSSETSRPEMRPPEGAASCLHALNGTVQQLLHALQRVLSSHGSFEDVTSLFTFICSSEMTAMKPDFSAEHLFECLCQQEYREKLCVGSAQLADLALNLERCVCAVDHAAGCSSWS